MDTLLLIKNHYEENFDKLVKAFAKSKDFSKEDAEDAVQDGYEWAVRGAHTYKPEIKAFKNWMGGVLYNAKKKHYNKFIKGRGEDSKLSDEDLPQPKEEQSTELVKQVLSSMSELEVRIWKMHKELGYSRRLTAKTLGIKENKVRNTISKMWRMTVV